MYQRGLQIDHFALHSHYNFYKKFVKSLTMSIYTNILNNIIEVPLSLADLQMTTGVSLPTLRKAVQELSDSQWIRVVGQSEPKGGRPAMLFGLDESVYAIVGVHLQLPGMRLITADLQGNVIHAEEAFSHDVPKPDETLDQIIAYVNALQQQQTERQILGVGIASPGFTDPQTGDILSIGRVEGWQNFPMCHALKTMLDLPVHIANDIDCMAFAEFQHTGTALDKNLCYVGFDEGVKMSMFLDGKLYKGAFGNVGLIATRLQDQNPLGDILTIHGVNKIFADKVNALDQSSQAVYDPILAIRDSRQRMQNILEWGVAGDEICADVTQMMIRYLVRSIVMATYLIQPDVLVLGGILSTAPKALYTQIETAIYEALPALFANHLVIRQATLSSPNRAALGASYHFLKTYLLDSNTDPLAIVSVSN